MQELRLKIFSKCFKCESEQAYKPQITKSKPTSVEGRVVLYYSLYFLSRFNVIDVLLNLSTQNCVTNLS